MADGLFDGRGFQLSTIVDDFARESLAVEVDQHLTGSDVATVLDRRCGVRGCRHSSVRC
jgi:putative transposase